MAGNNQNKKQWDVKKMTPKDWTEWREVQSVEEQDRAERNDTKAAETAYADDQVLLDAQANKGLTTEAAQSDWETLRRHAVVTFPEGRNHMGLTGPQKLVCIAHCLGWSNYKIAKASGLHERTTARWLQKPEARIFVTEYQIRHGETDPNALLNDIAYKGLKLAQQMLNSNDDSDSMKRIKVDLIKWAAERRWGKPNQPIEHKGPAMADVFKFIQQSAIATNSVVTTPEEEKDVFDDIKIN